MLRSFTLCIVATAAAFGLPSTPAVAGSFAVTPIRVELSGKALTGAVTLRNQQDAPVVIQAQVLKWEQRDGKDDLSPTQDLLVSPVVFTLPASGSQLVRVALQRPVDPARELSYRLILTEVPSESAAGSATLSVSLRLILPIFVEAQAATPAKLTWTARYEADGKLAVTARNDGETHARVLKFTVAPAAGPGATLEESAPTYLLPGQAGTWVLENNQKDGTAAADARRLRLKGMTEAGDFEVEVSPGAQ